jgi:hypothetical protein
MKVRAIFHSYLVLGLVDFHQALVVLAEHGERVITWEIDRIKRHFGGELTSAHLHDTQLTEQG